MLRFWKIHLPLSGPQPPPSPDGESDACLSHLPRLLLGCLDLIMPTMSCYQVSGSTASTSEWCFHSELRKRKTKTIHYLISVFQLRRGAGQAGTAYASAFLPAHLVLLSWTLREEAESFSNNDHGHILIPSAPPETCRSPWRGGIKVCSLWTQTGLCDPLGAEPGGGHAVWLPRLGPRGGLASTQPSSWSWGRCP